jgi:ABC-type Fe3+-hydroxamate transport system substrate-binding protein
LKIIHTILSKDLAAFFFFAFAIRSNKASSDLCPNNSMPFYTDQLGRTIELEHPPKRIISLVPSQTELLFDLGLNEEVAGITKFCVHPVDWFRTKQRVGGTKQLKAEKIKALQPDLIIANKEENVQEQIEELEMHFPVWISDVNNLDDAVRMISDIGDITGKQPAALKMANRIKNDFAQLRPAGPAIRTCYLIWRQPHMTIGGDTFINDMLERAGFENIFRERTRYPTISAEELKANNCQLILLSSEPFPFQQRHADEWKQQLPATPILFADGEMFSWYGSRLLKAPAYFKELRNQALSLSHAAGNG